MMQKSRFTIISLILLVISTGNLSAQEQELEFTTILSEWKSYPGYQLARAQWELSLKEEKLAALAGDPQLSLTPGYRSQSADLAGEGPGTLSVDLGLTVPLVRSALEEEKYQTALRKLESENLALAEAGNRQLILLSGLYGDLWLSQQEGKLLDAELEVARAKYEAALQLYEGGAGSLSALETAEEDLLAVEEEKNYNSLNQRLSWLELQQARGIETPESEAGPPEIPVLKDWWAQLSDPGLPHAMEERARSQSSSLTKEQNILWNLGDSFSRWKAPDFDLTVKPGLSYKDQDFSLSYGYQSRNLSASYGFDALSWNQNSSSTQDLYTLSLSLALSLGPGITNRKNIDLLETQLVQQELLYQYRVRQLSLDLRSAYQKLILAEEALDQAQRALDRLRRLGEAVEVRFQRGAALNLDLQSASLGIQRGEWKVLSAKLQLQQAKLVYMALQGPLELGKSE
jgi:outer membrane protein TolC